jgi:uncharacterized protein (TIGR02266 family)
MSSGSSKSDQRAQTRVPYSQPVRIRYRRFQDFIQEVSKNISSGGMFVASQDPPERGTVLDFELALEDGFTLIAGRGEVVWVRSADEGEDKPSGMGVRFLELEGSSRRLLHKIVEKRARERQETAAPTARRASASSEDQRETAALSREELAAFARPTATDEIQTERLAPVRASARQPHGISWLRLAALIVASAIAGGLIVLLFDLTWIRPKIRELERRVASLADAASRPTKIEPEALVAESEPEIDPETSSAAELDPLAVVSAWARAWSQGRVDDYLGFYADSFVPPGGVSRGEWEARRRSRVAGQSGISVQVLMAELERPREGEAVVRFVQSYRSERYADRVRKILRLVRENGRWKVVAEEVERALPD